jgi:hypothetical protein
MRKSFALAVCGRQRGGSQASATRCLIHHRISILLFIVILLPLVARETVAPPPATAGSSERRLLSITKTTVYGAILGGILGLASALVVRDGYEDDAIRWGVAVGTFSGFLYGAFSHEESDEFSLETRRVPGGFMRSPDRPALLNPGWEERPGTPSFARGSDPRADRVGVPSGLDRPPTVAPGDAGQAVLSGLRTIPTR